MISDVEKLRPNNGMLVSRDQNYSRIMASNTSKRVSHQCDIPQ